MKYLIIEGSLVEHLTIEGSLAEHLTIEGSLAEHLTIEGSLAEYLTIEGSLAEYHGTSYFPVQPVLIISTLKIIIISLLLADLLLAKN